jgi:glycosyltransferase involved in cell wall biosynthesis
MKDFRLVLAGGLENKQSHINYVNKIKEISNNYSIEILPNISWDELNEIFAKALIFWHASGLNEDENKNPEKFEHFGITTVEAMASGCIPIVINKGGQKEIIKDGVNGFTFNDVAELKQKTLFVIEHDKDMAKIRLQAIKDSKKYSDEVFEDELLKIISSAKKVLGTKHLLEKENRY